MADYPKFDLLPTADPNEDAVAVTCEVDNLRLAQMPVEESTTYAQFGAGDRSRADEFGSYIFTVKSKPGAGLLTFHFAKPKTEEEKRTPFKSAIERMGNHRWPDILLALGVTVDYSFPRSATIISGDTQGIVTAPRYRIAEALIPEMNEGTRFLVQQFQAPTMFTIPRYRTPSATAIRLVLPDGASYSHNECLHEEIELDPLPTAQTTLLSESGAPAGGIMGGQRFPASNFTRWRPYWFSDEQVLRDGVWYRRRVRVIPPRPSEAAFQLN
jgi:hypothetical protein